MMVALKRGEKQRKRQSQQGDKVIWKSNFILYYFNLMLSRFLLTSEFNWCLAGIASYTVWHFALVFAGVWGLYSNDMQCGRAALAHQLKLPALHERFPVFKPGDLEWSCTTHLAVQTYVLTLQPFNRLGYFDKRWGVYRKMMEPLKRNTRGKQFISRS